MSLTEQQKLRFEVMNEKALIKRAKALKIDFGNDWQREEMIEAILKEESTVAEAKVEKKNAKRADGLVTLQYLNKGSLKKFGKKWIGHSRRAVSPEEAENLVQNFPRRFKKI
jgi:hypothetical protein